MSICLVEMGLKKDFVHARKQSTSELCVFIFLKPDLLFCGFLISYVCIINASFYVIKLYKIHKICLKFKLKIKFRYISNIYIYFIKNKNLIVS
jgi:hypothetical protein